MARSSKLELKQYAGWERPSNNTYMRSSSLQCSSQCSLQCSRRRSSRKGCDGQNYKEKAFPRTPPGFLSPAELPRASCINNGSTSTIQGPPCPPNHAHCFAYDRCKRMCMRAMLLASIETFAPGISALGVKLHIWRYRLGIDRGIVWAPSFFMRWSWQKSDATTPSSKAHPIRSNPVAIHVTLCFWFSL